MVATIRSFCVEACNHRQQSDIRFPLTDIDSLQSGYVALKNFSLWNFSRETIALFLFTDDLIEEILQNTIRIQLVAVRLTLLKITIVSSVKSKDPRALAPFSNIYFTLQKWKSQMCNYIIRTSVATALVTECRRRRPAVDLCQRSFALFISLSNRKLLVLLRLWILFFSPLHCWESVTFISVECSQPRRISIHFVQHS